MATSNERKGNPAFDRIEKGFAGSGATLKREGTEKAPFDPGLFQRLVDVSWGTHGIITGQFFCVGDIVESSSELLGLTAVDTDFDNADANTQALNRGWITKYQKVFIFAEGTECPVEFEVGIRVPMFGHTHVLIAGGRYIPPGVGAVFQGLVACSTDNGQTWTDLRFPASEFNVDIGHQVDFLAFNPTTKTLYATRLITIIPIAPGLHYALLYKFTPGARPSAAGTWTFLKDDAFDHSAVAGPSSGYPALPSDFLPAGTYIANNTVYYDAGTGNFKYQGLNNGSNWYGGKVTFVGADGQEHTLEQPVDSDVLIDGAELTVDDPRFFGPNGGASAGNGLIVVNALKLDPDSTSPPDFFQVILIGSKDLGVTWEQITPTDIPHTFEFVFVAFGKNKL